MICKIDRIENKEERRLNDLVEKLTFIMNIQYNFIEASFIRPKLN